MSTNQAGGELPGELLRRLRKKHGYMSAKSFAEAIQAGEKPPHYRGVAPFAELTGWDYWKLNRLERIRREVPPSKWRTPFTRQDLDDLVEAQWIAEESELYGKFLDALQLQAQLLEEYGVSLPPDDQRPGPGSHAPASREEVMAVFDAVLAQWVNQMKDLGYPIELIEEMKLRVRNNVISMLEMLELLSKSQGTGKITPEDEVTRGEAPTGRNVQDIPRLRTLRLVYDLANEMIEDTLWEAKGAKEPPKGNLEVGSRLGR
jgi:hypothetical protein